MEEAGGMRDIGDDYTPSDPDAPHVAVFFGRAGDARAYVFASATEAFEYIERTNEDVAAFGNVPAESCVVPIFGLPA